jgi:hypothetical protein
LSSNCPGLVGFDPNDESVIGHPVVELAFTWIGESVSLAASNTAKLYPKFIGEQATESAAQVWNRPLLAQSAPQRLRARPPCPVAW